MIYLNNAASSFPKPKQVTDAVADCLSKPVLHAARTGFEREHEDSIYITRERLSKLFNVTDPLQIIFTSGSTEALNLAIRGLDLKGGHVVTTTTEHNSVNRPLKTLEMADEIEITFVDCDETSFVDPKKIEQAMKTNTKAVVINHCSNVTGTIQDVNEIAKIAHKYNAYIIVDASQSSGNIPIDFEGWDLDFMAFTGHKSLFGIQGTGGLIIKKGIDLKPLKVGGTGILSEILTQPEGLPIYYEAGTPNTPGIVALGAGVKFILDTGLENIIAHKKKLFNRIIGGIKDFTDKHNSENSDGIKIYTTGDNHSYSNFCFNVGGFVPEEIGYMLKSSFDILVRTGIHCAPLLLKPLGVEPWGTVRASFSYFTTEEEIDIFIDALNQIRQMFLPK